MDRQDRRVELASISPALAPSRRWLAVYGVQAPNISRNDITGLIAELHTAAATFPRLSCILWVATHAPVGPEEQEPLRILLTDCVLDRDATGRTGGQVYYLSGWTTECRRPFEATFHVKFAEGQPRGVLWFGDAVKPPRPKANDLPQVVWH